MTRPARAVDPAPRDAHTPRGMQPGHRVAERFEIELPAGAGGAGVVYRARDTQSGCTVALKVLRGQDAADVERIAQESRCLADLSHPGIVRYVAHGTTEDAALFL